MRKVTHDSLHEQDCGSHWIRVCVRQSIYLNLRQAGPHFIFHIPGENSWENKCFFLFDMRIIIAISLMSARSCEVAFPELFSISLWWDVIDKGRRSFFLDQMIVMKNVKRVGKNTFCRSRTTGGSHLGKMELPQTNFRWKPIKQTSFLERQVLKVLVFLLIWKWDYFFLSF